MSDPNLPEAIDALKEAEEGGKSSLEVLEDRLSEATREMGEHREVTKEEMAAIATETAREFTAGLKRAIQNIGEYRKRVGTRIVCDDGGKFVEARIGEVRIQLHPAEAALLYSDLGEMLKEFE